ncbi:MAG: ribosomal RNA small subunit methyltransferase A [Frankia sp.]
MAGPGGTGSGVGAEGPHRPGLLTPSDVRALVAALDLRPTKMRGQNFLIDPNTIRRIVRASGVGPDDVVLEIGPGLGSLTLGLLGAARRVVAVEVDPALAAALPATVAARLGPPAAARLRLVVADALRITPADLAEAPGSVSGGPGGRDGGGGDGRDGGDGTADGDGAVSGEDQRPEVLAANLPYNVSVPLLLGLLERFPTLDRGLVMVQAEVAERLTAAPGSRIYGVPSVKLAWWAQARAAGPIGRAVFWPRPNVDSSLVAFSRISPPGDEALRRATFAVVDAAFAQRRKTLRAALAGWAGSAPAAETVVRAAGVDPGARGEALDLAAFVAIARAGRAGESAG